MLQNLGDRARLRWPAVAGLSVRVGLAERGWRGGWVGECGTFQHDRAPSQGSGRRLYGPYHRGGVGGALLGPYNLLIFVVRGRFEIWEPLVLIS